LWPLFFVLLGKRAIMLTLLINLPRRQTGK
jgi:hypothetical protein